MNKLTFISLVILTLLVSGCMIESIQQNECTGYFYGYVCYDDGTCIQEEAGGCNDPFSYHTLEECEAVCS